MAIDKRTFGYYSSPVEALEAVLQNKSNLQEGLYDYVVIEAMEEGIHPISVKEDWFNWDKELNTWKRCEKPAEFKNTINFSLG